MAKAPKKSAKQTANPSASRPKAGKSAPKKLLRKVTKASAAKTPARATTASRGAQPTALKPHYYIIALVPRPCENWVEGDIVEIYVSEPPPAIVTLMSGDACDGTKAILDE